MTLPLLRRRANERAASRGGGHRGPVRGVTGVGPESAVLRGTQAAEALRLPCPFVRTRDLLKADRGRTARPLTPRIPVTEDPPAPGRAIRACPPHRSTQNKARPSLPSRPPGLICPTTPATAHPHLPPADLAVIPGVGCTGLRRCGLPERSPNRTYSPRANPRQEALRSNVFPLPGTDATTTGARHRSRCTRG